VGGEAQFLARPATPQPPVVGRHHHGARRALEGVLDLAGPREEQLADMTRRYARAIGYRGPVFAVNVPGDQMKGMRNGLNLPGEGAVLGTQTFDQWLETVRH
jgi:hypothetical protein